MPSPDHPTREHHGSIWRDAVHIFVLASFAVAQPLFDVLGGSPEFFYVEHQHATHVLFAALLPSVALPTALVGCEALAGVFGRRGRMAIHAVLVAVLTAILVLPPLNRLAIMGPVAVLLCAGALALGGTSIYFRFPVARTVLLVLAPAVVIFPVLFLLRAPGVDDQVTSAAAGERDRGSELPGPVVVVVFDELPTTVLVTDRWEIDSTRYPNFAALARDGTWFRNATTVASVTQAALGAMLSGTHPEPSASRMAQHRSQNLFTLLRGRYELHVTESYVRFCPDTVCGESAADEPTARARGRLVSDLGILLLHLIVPRTLNHVLPDLSHPALLIRPEATEVNPLREALDLLAHQREINDARLSEREESFARFIDQIVSQRGFYYLHTLLPHAPYVYLPDGKICTPGLFQQPARWSSDEASVIYAYQRFLLQVGHVDTLIGDLVGHLQRQGLYDSTLLVVTADHGVSHRPGDHRRGVTASNFCDILAVPLFLKAPYQRTGGISDRNVEATDLLPTITAILGLPIPWSTDGRSAVDAAVPERPGKTMWGPYWPNEKTLLGEDGRATFPPAFPVACRTANQQRFARSAETEDPFRLGPYGELVGEPVQQLRVADQPSGRAEIAHAGLYNDVDPGGEFAPCAVLGRLSADGGHGPIDVALAVNGTIRSVSRVSMPSEGWRPFAIAVPEGTFRTGKNTVELFAVHRHDETPHLTPMLGGRGVTYTLEESPGELRLRESAGGKDVVLPVKAGILGGEFEMVGGSGGSHIRFRGWAADVERRELPRTIVVFVEGKFYHAEPPTIARVDVQNRYVSDAILHSGFEFKVPLGRHTYPAILPAVRVVAVSMRGVAAELHLRQADASSS